MRVIFSDLRHYTEISQDCSDLIAICLLPLAGFACSASPFVRACLALLLLKIPRLDWTTAHDDTIRHPSFTMCRHHLFSFAWRCGAKDSTHLDTPHTASFSSIPSRPFFWRRAGPSRLSCLFGCGAGREREELAALSPFFLAHFLRPVNRLGDY